jgi:hypothetical protein
MNTMSIQHEQLRIVKNKKARSNAIFTCKKIKNQKKWTREEDELLIVLAEKYNEKHWKEISRRFVKKNSLQCFSRYKRIRPGIIKGSWKKEEDLRIIDLVNKYGKAWSKISKILGTRNGKQIRDRFINVLDPEIRKGKFTEEEDRKLISLYKQNGPKWATIAKYYPNRTADMIKNRFHSSIKKKMGGDNTEKFSNLKECKEELSICKNDYSTNVSNKSIINLTNAQNGNFSLENAYFTSNLASPNTDMIMSEADNYDNRNFGSTITSRVCDSDIYSSNNFNYDVNYERDEKSEEACGANSFIWNFEDYFTI